MGCVCKWGKQNTSAERQGKGEDGSFLTEKPADL